MRKLHILATAAALLVTASAPSLAASSLAASRLQTTVKREECRSLVGRGEIENQTIELVKPQTYMNLSGEAVKCLLIKEERSAERLMRSPIFDPNSSARSSS